MRCSLLDDAPAATGRRSRCSMCGAQLFPPSVDDSAPRAELDTLRLDASSLATLVRLGEATHAAAARGEPGQSPRAPQMSIPFELARQRAVPLGAPRTSQVPLGTPRVPAELLGAPRPQQTSIPFELVRQQPSITVHEAPPDELPEVPIAAPTLRVRHPGAEEWEGTFVARVRGRKKRWALTLFLLLMAIVLAVGSLVASGRIDPRILLQ
ncbi:MAG TPA: hypothetical protein VF395_08045 [Polyangiaceae bacterium]